MKNYRICLLIASLAIYSFAGVQAHAQDMRADRVYPRFALGPTGAFVTIEKGLKVTVADVQANTPAAGKLLKGDVLISIGSKDLAVPDPRVPLGQAIGQAEGRGGTLNLKIKRGAATKQVTIKLKAMGAYSATWPRNCKKSDSIISATAAFVVASQQQDGSYNLGGRKIRDDLSGCLTGLFLLSTGESKYLPRVATQARALAKKVEARPTGSNWHLGYQGILLAEYYLKTGDRSVLPGLKSLCDHAISVQAAGAWGHGGIPNAGYVQSGLLNSAGLPVLTTLILGRECGIAVDEKKFAEALKFFYRMAGHGNVCYGDHRAELWWPNTNGRNAMLACTLNLLDEPRYKKAAEHTAMMMADSYYKPEFGHTGGGFNVIWRGMGTVHVPKTGQASYRRQMDELAWYYDLCRQPGGGFSILPTPPDNKRYSGLTWGTGAIGLTYTAPRKTLRITGAPRTQYSKTTKRPVMNWGSTADLTFFETRHASGFGKESANPREIYDKLIGKQKKQSSVAFCAQHLRHYNPLVRTWAAKNLRERNTPEAIKALAEAVGHKDARVRRAAFDGASGYDNWGRPFRGKMASAEVSKRLLPVIVKTLKSPSSAWWEIDGALFALGAAQPEDIRKHRAIIDKYAGHSEWYLREGAFWALVGVGDQMSGEEFDKLAKIYDQEDHVFARSSFDAGFKQMLKRQRTKLSDSSIGKAAKTLGRSTYNPPVAPGYGTGGIHEAAHRTMMILNHFDSKNYKYLVGDFVKYLDKWEPYYQHSTWLITGSKWQPGLLKVIDILGADAKPLCIAFKKVLANYSKFDKKRIGKDAKPIEQKIRDTLSKWEAKYGAIR